MSFWRTGHGVLIMLLLVAVGAAGAWRIRTSTEHREARETQLRIERDAKNAIDNAAENTKLCPLSQRTATGDRDGTESSLQVLESESELLRLSAID